MQVVDPDTMLPWFAPVPTSQDKKLKPEGGVTVQPVRSTVVPGEQVR